MIKGRWLYEQYSKDPIYVQLHLYISEYLLDATETQEQLTDTGTDTSISSDASHCK